MNDFGAIYEEHQTMVYRFLFRMCRQEALAEELTRETFYQAMRGWKRFDGKSSVSTWLCAIAKNLYYSSLRKKPELPLADVHHTKMPDMAESLLQSDRQMLALRLLHHLSEPYREVFTLRTFCDLSHGQIGELFEKSDGWARVTYYRARQMLMEAMKMEMIENDILCSEYQSDGMIISTTQISKLLNVNPTTSVKAVSKLTDEGIPYKKKRAWHVRHQRGKRDDPCAAQRRFYWYIHS